MYFIISYPILLRIDINISSEFIYLIPVYDIFSKSGVMAGYNARRVALTAPSTSLSVLV